MKKGLLLMIAVVGSIISYYTVNLFIVSISFMQYFAIEIIITAMHQLYNQAKKNSLNINPQ
jgi:hypothetical protein